MGWQRLMRPESGRGRYDQGPAEVDTARGRQRWVQPGAGRGGCSQGPAEMGRARRQQRWVQPGVGRGGCSQRLREVYSGAGRGGYSQGPAGVDAARGWQRWMQPGAGRGGCCQGPTKVDAARGWEQGLIHHLLHWQVGQPLLSKTFPCSQKMRHTGPQTGSGGDSVRCINSYYKLRRAKLNQQISRFIIFLLIWGK